MSYVGNMLIVVAQKVHQLGGNVRPGQSITIRVDTKFGPRTINYVLTKDDISMARDINSPPNRLPRNMKMNG